MFSTQIDRELASTLQVDSLEKQESLSSMIPSTGIYEKLPNTGLMEKVGKAASYIPFFGTPGQEVPAQNEIKPTVSKHS